MVSLILAAIFFLALEGTKKLIIMSSCTPNIPLINTILVLNLGLYITKMPWILINHLWPIKFSTFMIQNLEIQNSSGFLLTFLLAFLNFLLHIWQPTFVFRRGLKYSSLHANFLLWKLSVRVSFIIYCRWIELKIIIYKIVLVIKPAKVFMFH